MAEIGRGLYFGEEPLCPDDRSERGGKNLQRDLAVMPEVFSQVDCGHATLS